MTKTLSPDGTRAERGHNSTYHCKCGRERFQDEPSCSFCIKNTLDILVTVIRDQLVPALQAVVQAADAVQFKVTVDDFCTVQATVNAAIKEAATHGPSSGRAGCCEHGWSNETSIREPQGILHRRTCHYCGMIQVAAHEAVMLGDPDWKQVQA